MVDHLVGLKNQQSHRIHMPERLLDTPKHRGGDTPKHRGGEQHGRSMGPDSLPSAMAHKAPLPMFLFIDRSRVILAYMAKEIGREGRLHIG